MIQPRPAMPPRFAVRLPRLALVLGLGLLAGCSGSISAPYFITVENQRLDPVSTLPLFSVCYNATLHKPESIRALAAQHCAGAKPIFNGQDLKHCSLSAPSRVTYTCSALSRTASEARPNLPTDFEPQTKVAF